MLKRVLSTLVILAVCAAGISVTTGQDEPTIMIELTVYEGNPVLTHGEVGAWDAMLFYPSVVYQDGLFHMFYGGWAGGPTDKVATGYATSEDGLNWTPYENSPVFELDESIGFWGGLGIVMVDGEIWVGYVCVASTAGDHCEIIHRATAPEPIGPWTVSLDLVLAAGSGADWDSTRFLPFSVVKAVDEYVLYYTNRDFGAIGRATSPDGVTWTKFDDPTTTERQYENSAPVMTTDPGSRWERSWIGSPYVLLGDDAWEMFYTGALTSSAAVGYATSEDGVVWTRFPDNPVLTISGISPLLGSVVVVDDVYYLYYAEAGVWNISVATGTVTWE
jgi:predicted GH43/DUF377 family glycosyl hydrolase